MTKPVDRRPWIIGDDVIGINQFRSFRDYCEEEFVLSLSRQSFIKLMWVPLSSCFLEAFIQLKYEKKFIFKSSIINIKMNI
jgi:hypothetical protein